MSDLETFKSLDNDGRLRGQVVRLRGLPYSATAADVVAFFDGIPIVGDSAGVVLTFTPDGRPTGGGSVTFWACTVGKAQRLCANPGKVRRASAQSGRV